MITEARLNNFTAFQKFEIAFSPGINVFIGKNGTGKTHIMKVVYAACDITESQRNYAEKLERVFYPSQGKIGRLANRAPGSLNVKVTVSRKDDEGKKRNLTVSFSNHTGSFEKAEITGIDFWKGKKIKSVFIPVKDMLANAPGFNSLYAQREIHFEEIYNDIITRALLPQKKGLAQGQKKLLDILQEKMEGTVLIKNQEFFLKNAQGNLEFTLLAEGLRKLALLSILIKNEVLTQGSVLFWDEPESNLNPELADLVAEIFLTLQRQGVQIFIATHDYLFLRWLSLKAKADDQIMYHSLYRDEEQKIACSSTNHYLKISPNAIDAGFEKLVSEEIVQNVGGMDQ